MALSLSSLSLSLSGAVRLSTQTPISHQLRRGSDGRSWCPIADALLQTCSSGAVRLTTITSPRKHTITSQERTFRDVAMANRAFHSTWENFYRIRKSQDSYFCSEHLEPLHNCIPEDTAKESAKLVKETADNVDKAVRELPDANLKPKDLWAKHSKVVLPKPHSRDNSSWKAIQKVLESSEKIGLKHFKPVKPLGSGDTGSVHLVQLLETGEYFAMKAMDKNAMLNRNKIRRLLYMVLIFIEVKKIITRFLSFSGP